FLQVSRNQALIAAFEKALRGEKSIDRISMSDRQIEIRVFPVQTSSELAAVALFIDITEIERLQRVRKEFLDDFSHEVRTPLTGLRSAVETFEHGALTNDQDEQLRHVMLRQLSRLERLVRDLAELHRIESGELVLDKHTVAIRDLLEECAIELGDAAHVTIRGDGAMAWADADRVQQIFSNLLDNALKYGGGKIDVDVARSENDVIVT